MVKIIFDVSSNATTIFSISCQIDRFVAILFPANSKNQKPEEKCTIKLDVSGGSVIRSDIKHSDDTYCGTKISEVSFLFCYQTSAMCKNAMPQGKNGQGRRKGTTQVKCKGMKKSEMHIVSYDDGQEVMRDQGNWESCSARSGGRGNSQIGTWENLANLNQAMQTKFFIESPPLAGIFAECEWMDWISEEYPNKHRTGREWELRIEVAKKKKMRRHVCGDVPEAAHYVDAVTTEKRIPWYELKTGMSKYEAYKLSPFHGYLCADSNTPNQPEYCQDMKVGSTTNFSYNHRIPYNRKSSNEMTK